MVSVFIKTDSHHQVERERIRKLVEKILLDKKIKTSVEVSISIVGDRQMKTLNNKYRKINETTDVLSFPLLVDEQGAPFVEPPDRVLRLGDIVISYPQAIDEAADEEKLVDQKIDELVEHGLMHLLGNHHE